MFITRGTGNRRFFVRSQIMLMLNVSNYKTKTNNAKALPVTSSPLSLQGGLLLLCESLGFNQIQVSGLNTFSPNSQ